MKIRLANLNDLKTLMDINQRCIENLDKQGIYQWDDIYPSEDDFQKDILENNLFFITSADKIMGCICINQFEPAGYENADWIGSRFFVIHKIMVNPKSEGRGFGKFAMSYAENVARSSEKDSIRLDCFKDNLRAKKFYQNLGYILRGETRFRKGMFNLYEKMI